MFFPIPISGISSGQADSAAAHGAPWFGHSLYSSLSPGQVTKIQTQIKFPLNSFRTWQEMPLWAIGMSYSAYGLFILTAQY
jgi:hypothetical protein